MCVYIYIYTCYTHNDDTNNIINHSSSNVNNSATTNSSYNRDEQPAAGSVPDSGEPLRELRVLGGLRPGLGIYSITVV